LMRSYSALSLITAHLIFSQTGDFICCFSVQSYYWLYSFCAILMGGRASSAQSITIFGNGVPRDGAINGSYMPPRAGTTFGETLGVKFWSSQIGVISGIRFYTVVCPGGYVAGLYSADGTWLGSGTTVDASADPGWREADFASPVPISANTTYIAAYYCAAGLYTYLPEGLSQGFTNGPLTARPVRPSAATAYIVTAMSSRARVIRTATIMWISCLLGRRQLLI